MTDAWRGDLHPEEDLDDDSPWHDGFDDAGWPEEDAGPEYFLYLMEIEEDEDDEDKPSKGG